MEEGIFYSPELGKKFLVAKRESLIINSSVYYLIETNSVVYTDISIDADFEKKGTIDIYEGTTVSNNGVAIPAVCSNRTLNLTSETKVYKNPTVVSNGSTLVSISKLNTSNLYEDCNCILKKNTKYLIKISNTSPLTSWISIKIVWRELV